MGNRRDAPADTVDLVSAWLRHLSAGSASAATRRLRAYHVRAWLTWRARAGRRSPWSATVDEVAGYLASGGPRGRGWSVETRRSARASIAGFYRWARDTGRAPAGTAVERRHPCEGLPALRPPRAVARPCPDPVLVEAMTRAPERVRLMMALAGLAGARRGEIARVRLDDVELHPPSVLILGKGGHRRRVPLPAMLARQLRRHAHPDTGVVFARDDGQPMTVDHVGRLISRGLPAGWTAHTLRHRFATAAYAGGGQDVMAVRELLGHASVTTTQRYIATPADAVMAAAAGAQQLVA